jgi:replication factor C large subunit
VEALANDMEWDMEEKNASSQTLKDDIQRLIQSIRSQGVEKTLFLIDECDSMNSNSLKEFKKIIDNPPNPIIFTANEEWKVPDAISNSSKSHEFKLQKRSIKPVVRDIAEEEGIDISKKDIGKLATRNGLRDAINDLQRYAKTGNIGWDQREQDIGNFEAVDNILRGKKYSGEMTPPDLVEWLDENIHETMSGVEAMRAFECIAEADKFVELANSTQNYSWWKYAGSIAEEVANVRLTEPYDWINKSYPQARRNYIPKPSYDDPIASMYREIKDTDSYSGSFGFHEFRRTILPFLKNKPEEERKKLVLNYSLSPKAMKALDLSESDYDDWIMEEKEEGEEGEESNTDNQTEESDERSIFDF